MVLELSVFRGKFEVFFLLLPKTSLEQPHPGGGNEHP